MRSQSCSTIAIPSDWNEPNSGTNRGAIFSQVANSQRGAHIRTEGKCRASKNREKRVEALTQLAKDARTHTNHHLETQTFSPAESFVRESPEWLCDELEWSIATGRHGQCQFPMSLLVMPLSRRLCPALQGGTPFTPGTSCSTLEMTTGTWPATACVSRS